MKKIISTIVLITLFLNSFYLFGYAENPDISIDEMHEQLCSMISRNDAVHPSSESSNLANRLIVKTDSNEALEENYDAKDCVEGYKGIHIFQYETKAQTDTAYQSFLNDNIEYVEYDFYFQIESDIASYEEIESEMPNNHLSWNSDVAKVDEAFELIESSGVECREVVVAVIDSGLYWEHTFFSSARLIDSGFTPVEEESGTMFPSTVDDMNHGTHVAGIIYDNTMENVKISPYRVFGNIDLAPYSLIWTAFEMAVKNGSDVVNMSFAGKSNEETNEQGEYYYALLNQSIKEAVDNNVFVIVAAGNKRGDADTNYPGNCPSAVTVAGTDERNLPDVSYSASGKCVDIAAPGTNINSAVPRLWNWWEHDVSKNQIYEPTPASLYKEISGTSMATPLVSALAATIKSICPDITAEEFERILKETSYIPHNWEDGCYGKNYGVGIVNFYNMVKAVLQPETSDMPTIKINSDNKIEIVSPKGTDSRIYYTLDGTVPTIENHLNYTEPLVLINTYAEKITAVCHENGKLIGEPVTYDLLTYETKNIFYKYSDMLVVQNGSENAYWSSYNPDVVSVDNKGNITANSIGTTKIICRLQTGERVIWNVKVRYTPIQAFFVLFFLGFLWI